MSSEMGRAGQERTRRKNEVRGGKLGRMTLAISADLDEIAHKSSSDS